MAVGWVTGGDSGSPLATAAVRTGQLEAGDKAAGIITHSIVVVGAPLFWATTIAQAADLVEAALPMNLLLVNEDFSTTDI